MALEHPENEQGRLGMRTLLRPGRTGHLVKIEGRGGTRFLFNDQASRKPRVLFDLDEAMRVFEAAESQVAARMTNPAPSSASPDH